MYDKYDDDEYMGEGGGEDEAGGTRTKKKTERKIITHQRRKRRRWRKGREKGWWTNCTSSIARISSAIWPLRSSIATLTRTTTAYPLWRYCSPRIRN